MGKIFFANWIAVHVLLPTLTQQNLFNLIASLLFYTLEFVTFDLLVRNKYYLIITGSQNRWGWKAPLEIVQTDPCSELAALSLRVAWCLDCIVRKIQNSAFLMGRALLKVKKTTHLGYLICWNPVVYTLILLLSLMEMCVYSSDLGHRLVTVFVFL